MQPQGGRFILSANVSSEASTQDRAAHLISSWPAAAFGVSTCRGETHAGTKNRARRGRSRRRRQGLRETEQTLTWAALPCRRSMASTGYALTALDIPCH